MINKNFYRKTNDKKILHKVGKQWKVVSVALLMAVAGGAVAATHANANADAVNDQPLAANQAQFKPSVKPASAKPSQNSASASVEYYPAESGSAAMYFDKVASDEAVAAKNYDTVNAYVQSLNNEYNPQVNSYSAKSASASDAAKKDASLASSFSAVNNNPATAKTINSLAVKNHFVNAQLYQGMVQGQEEEFSGTVSSASNDVKAASDVQSLVNKLANTNLSSTSLNASASAVFANSNLAAASANLNSVIARYGGNNTEAGEFVNVANRLSAGATTLNELQNDVMYTADVDQIDHGYNSTSMASLSADLTSDVNDAVSSATSSLSTLASNAVSDGALNNGNYTNSFSLLNSYAGSNGSEGTFNHFVAPNAYSGADFNYTGNAQASYNAAVSAAANPRLAGALESVATSLYGKYNPEFATASELAEQASAAKRSAENRLTAAQFADDFANANSSVVSEVSYDVATAPGKTASDRAANVAANYLNEGVTSLEEHFNLVNPNDNTKYDVTSYSKFVPALATQATQATQNTEEQTLIKDIMNNANFEPNNYTGNVNGIATKLLSARGLFSSVATTTFDNDTDQKDLGTGATGQNITSGTTVKNTGNDSLQAIIDGSTLTKQQKEIVTPQVLNDALNFSNSNTSNITANSTTLSNLDSALVKINTALNDAYNNVSQVAVKDGNGLKPDTTSKPSSNASYAPASAALLSDGINLSQLEAESGAINTVATNAKSAAKSSDIKSESGAAEQFNDELSVAASSANSALGSAQDASEANSTANDDDVTLASYFATSYSNAGNSESAYSTSVSADLNNFFKSMANDPTFDDADDAYAGAEAAAANDKKMGVANSKYVYNHSAHFLDVLKNAKLHSSYDFGSNGDKVVGTANKGDRLTVLGVNFNRNGLKHGATRYLVKDNTTGKTGFFTGQPQFSKAAYLNAVYDTNNVDVSVKTLKPVNVMDNINGGKVVKTLPAGTVVDGVTIVSDNPSNDAMGFTKVETSDYNFFTANVDYVELNAVVPKNNNNNNEVNNFAFNLSNINLAKAYNNNSQY